MSVTIHCDSSWDHNAVMRALVQAQIDCGYDRTAAALVDRLIAGQLALLNPPTYQRPEPGTYIGGGLIARPEGS
jgi:hypothetical protein